MQLAGLIWRPMLITWPLPAQAGQVTCIQLGAGQGNGMSPVSLLAAAGSPA